MNHTFNQTITEDKLRMFWIDFCSEIADVGRRAKYRDGDPKRWTVVLAMASFGATDLDHAKRVASRHGLEITYWATSANYEGYDINVHISVMPEVKEK